MKRSVATWTGSLAAAVLASTAWAQQIAVPLTAGPVVAGKSSGPVYILSTPCQACPAPAQPMAPGQTPLAAGTPGMPSTAESQPQGETAATGGETGAYGGLGQDVGGSYTGNYAAAGVGASAGVSGGGGTAATDATTGVTAKISVTTSTSTSLPLILPGLLTAADAEGALPVNRVYFNYGFLDGFKVGPTTTTSTITGVDAQILKSNTNQPIRFVTPNGTLLFTKTFSPNNGNEGTATIVVPQPGTVVNQQSIPAHAAFDLDRFDIGVEKTFLDGLGSVYLRVPFLEATQNTSGQPIDGLGDVTAGFKLALLVNQETGSALTAGFTVSAPTARDAIITTTTLNTVITYPAAQTNSTQPTSTTPGTAIVMTRTLNPTYLQPWGAGLLVLDHFFIQEYLGAIIPTDSQVPVYLTSDLVAGYQLYEAHGDSLLTSVSPFVGTQALIPVSGNSFDFPTQVFVSAGAGVRLCKRVLVSGSYVTPVVGPKAFNGGGSVGVNFFY